MKEKISSDSPFKLEQYLLVRRKAMAAARTARKADQPSR